MRHHDAKPPPGRKPQAAADSCSGRLSNVTEDSGSSRSAQGGPGEIVCMVALGHYRATFRFVEPRPPTIAWWPRRPRRRDPRLTALHFRRYNEARDDFLQAVCDAIGEPVTLVDCNVVYFGETRS